ncbi:MAG: hypothetical protein U1E27_01990, partial [Kiritimatiellia bacterium]|nr:hypothetical protein [Kiritimatiellia bacterium]
MIKIISLILFSCFLPQSAESKERIFLFDEGYDAAAFKWLHLREAGGEKPVFEKKDTSVKKTGESSIRGELTTAGQSIDWTTVDYPVKPDTVYAVSLWVKTDNARFMLRQNPRTAAGERVEGGMRNIAQLIGNKEWTKVETKIKTDAATERMSFTFFFHTMSGEGAGGSVWVDGIAFRQEVVEVGNEIEFRLHINHYMDDKVYYAAENEPVVMLMTARNNANHKWNNPRFRLLLPEGIHMLGSDYDARPYAAAVAITHEGRPYRLYEYTVPLPRNTLINVNYDQASLRSMALALRAEMKPSDTLHDAYIWYIDDEIECHTYHFHIKITESIFDSIPIQTPTLFSSTASIPFSLELTGPALQEMAAHYAACGFNGVSIPQFLRAGSETGS